MTFSISRTPDGVTVIAICGELDVTTVAQLRPALDDVVGRRPARVDVDLNELRMIDSIGLAALISLYKRMHAQGGDLVLRELRGQPLAIFRLVHLDRVMGAAQASAR